MRRTRRLLTTGTTEVPEREEKTGGNGDALPLVGTCVPFGALNTTSEGCNREEDDMAPPLKRFKLPEKVLARLGKTQACTEKKGEVRDLYDDEISGVMQEKRLAVVKRGTTAGNDVTGQGQKPVVSARRIPRHQFEEQQQMPRCVSNPPPERFANSNDDVICFGTARHDKDADSSSSLSSSSLWSLEESTNNGGSVAAARVTQRAREVDRHFSGYGSDDLEVFDNPLLEEEEEEEEDEENNSEEQDIEEKNNNNDGDGDEGTQLKSGKTGGGFGLLERRRQQQQQQPQAKAPKACEGHVAPITTNDTVYHRFRYSSMFFEMHIGREGTNPCHHTLFCVNGPITIQGPCGIIGFGFGEVAVGGFFLGKKQIALLSDREKAVVTPVPRIKNKSAGLESLPVPVCFKQPNGPVTVVPPTIRENHVDAEDSYDVDMFGTIDWDWVEATVKSWRGRFASKMPSIVLVVQLNDLCGVPPTRRHFFKRKEKHSAGNSFVDVPRFVARRHECGIDEALLPGVIPAIVKQGPGAVVVLGSQGIGKSTLARFLANALFSQHGVCYWLDLDLGQPEFSPPGVLSLYCVQRPLFCPHDTTKVKLVKSFFLGGSRLRCPVATAIAIEQLCAFVEPLQRRFPVVVNTHGWVLSTGRRMTVEVIRRLQPKHIIHLVKEGETRWARNSEMLMDPVEGLNSGVLHKRFLVHPLTLDTTGKTNDECIGQLPHPHPTMSNSAVTTTGWCGMVHTVQVNRKEELLQGGMRLKASAVRRAIWQHYLSPILHYYESLDKRRREMAGNATHPAGDDEFTTLFKGMLRRFDAIVFADIVDVRDMTEEVMCATLEYSVVALSISVGPSFLPGAVTTEQQGRTRKEKSMGESSRNYYCLADMPSGFPVSCFGVVESTEADMRRSGEIKIRFPFRRDILRDMLTAGGEKEKIRLSIACTSADRADVAALEAYF